MQYSVVKFSEKESISSRLDAEYYHPIFLETEQILKRGRWDYLENLSESIKSFGAYSLCNQVEYKEDGIPFLRCKDIKNGVIDFSDVLYIDSGANKLLWKSEVKPKTVLLTMSGTVGNSAIAPEEIKYPINSNQDVAKITVSEKLNPYYFSIFLQSRYGKKQISRLPIGSVQQHIFLWQIEKIVVPIFGNKFQSSIETTFKHVLSLHDISGKAFKEAQSLLLSEFGLLDWQPKHRLTFFKNYSDTERAERFDAEYFQPKYDEIELKLSKFQQKPLKVISNLINYGTVPTSPYVDKGTAYIKGLNLINGFIKGPFDKIENTSDLPKKYYTKENDIVISQMGTVGKAGLVSKKQENHLFASFTIRVRLKDSDFIDPVVLTFYINKIARPYYLLRKVAQASVRQNTDLPTINNMNIPKLKNSLQKKIREKVLLSCELEMQSKRLLEIAKDGVEMAIEKDEKTAMKWLDKQI